MKCLTMKHIQIDPISFEGDDKAKAEHTTMKQMGVLVEEEERGSNRSQKMPSPEIEEEEQQSHQGGADLETTPFTLNST